MSRSVFVAMAALVLLSACGTTGNVPPPEPAPPPPVPVPPSGDLDQFGYGKPVLVTLEEGTSAQGFATIEENNVLTTQAISLPINVTGPMPDGLVNVEIGGINYEVPVTYQENLNGGILGYVSNLIASDPDVGNKVTIRALTHSFVGELDMQQASLSGFVHGGWSTPIASLPDQIVRYDGRYLGWNDLGGKFSANADFDDGSFWILLIEDEEEGFVGIGLGTIEGNGFSSTFNITGANNPAHDMTGQLQGGFYGPEAEEITGVFSGTFTDSGDPAAGVIAGAISDEPPIE